ncbi:MAG: CDP-glycerol glycerophosphotransferase family protein [Alphaproteobacteria bacterium]|nr:CDP-glycerol glycerophosphotransferase family protein [Alphaproteobacteria bacterium]
MENEILEKMAARIDALEKLVTRLSSSEQAQNAALQEAAQRMSRLEKVSQLIIESAVKTAKDVDGMRLHRAFKHASKIFPKTKSVIFLGREYFGDNVKYAFLSFYDKAKKAGIECNFISYTQPQYEQLLSAGLPCLPYLPTDWSADDIKTILRAKVVIECNVFFPYREHHLAPYALLEGAKFIQLWHGMAIKEIGRDLVYPLAEYSPTKAEGLASTGMFDIFVGGSESTHDYWAQKFSFKEYAATGYPRNDVMLREVSERDLINVDREAFSKLESDAKSKKPIILYAPTFREDKASTWFKDAQIDILAEHCHRKGYVFCINLHPFESESTETWKQRYPQVYFIEKQTDIYPLLKHVSVMITDYSSLVLDFLLCDRPIIFYRPDHDAYTNKSRSLVEGHEQFICGAEVAKIDDMILAVDEAITAWQSPETDKFGDVRSALTKRLYDYKDSQASDRVGEVIMKLLED